MTKTLKILISLVLTLVVSHQTWSQNTDFTLESDYIEIAQDQNQIQGITSTLQKQGNNLIWIRQIEGTSRMTFFGILQSTQTQWDASTKSGTLTYRIEANGLEGQLTIKTEEETPSTYKAILKIVTFLNKTEEFSLHLTNITFK